MSIHDWKGHGCKHCTTVAPSDLSRAVCAGVYRPIVADVNDLDRCACAHEDSDDIRLQVLQAPQGNVAPQ